MAEPKFLFVVGGEDYVFRAIRRKLEELGIRTSGHASVRINPPFKVPKHTTHIFVVQDDIKASLSKHADHESAYHHIPIITAPARNDWNTTLECLRMNGILEKIEIPPETPVPIATIGEALEKKGETLVKVQLHPAVEVSVVDPRKNVAKPEPAPMEEDFGPEPGDHGFALSTTQEEHDMGKVPSLVAWGIPFSNEEAKNVEKKFAKHKGVPGGRDAYVKEELVKRILHEYGKRMTNGAINEVVEKITKKGITGGKINDLRKEVGLNPTSRGDRPENPVSVNEVVGWLRSLKVIVEPEVKPTPPKPKPVERPAERKKDYTPPPLPSTKEEITQALSPEPVKGFNEELEDIRNAIIAFGKKYNLRKIGILADTEKVDIGFESATYGSGFTK